MKLWNGLVIAVGVFFFVIGMVENITLIPSSVLIAGGTVAMSISCLNNDAAERVGKKPQDPN